MADAIGEMTTALHYPPVLKLPIFWLAGFSAGGAQNKHRATGSIIRKNRRENRRRKK
ncbi:MAG: hypothetical protein MPK09_02205 [Gammaproteobacteria bacterium]|nr:hypothetical protein [Gammaproteobacteria bacterium]